MQEYPVRLLQKMLEIYSPSGSEQDLASFLESEMNANGLNPRIDPYGNVVGELGGHSPTLLLCGHMDTVTGELPVKMEDGFIYGRGAVDAKSSLAAMIAGCVLARQRGPIGCRVRIAGVVEEETSSRGMKGLISDGCACDLAVFGEPSGLSSIIIGYKGSLQVEASIQTKPGHSSSPWLSKSAFDEALRFWQKISENILGNSRDSKFYSTTGCVTRIESGEGTNSTPSKALIRMDIRTPPGIHAELILDEIKTLGRASEKADGVVEITVSGRNQSEAYLGDADSLGVRLFRGAIREITGQNVALLKKTGTSDMNELAPRSRAPMIAYGPGDSSLDHTDDERIEIRELLSASEVYARAIERFSSITREKPEMQAIA